MSGGKRESHTTGGARYFCRAPPVLRFGAIVKNLFYKSLLIKMFSLGILAEILRTKQRPRLPFPFITQLSTKIRDFHTLMSYVLTLFKEFELSG